MHAYLRQARQLEAVGKGDGRGNEAKSLAFFVVVSFRFFCHRSPQPILRCARRCYPTQSFQVPYVRVRGIAYPLDRLSTLDCSTRRASAPKRMELE